jgi:uncharacterized protein (TIGR00255 family)
MSAAVPAKPLPLRSMTGFAEQQGTLADGRTFALTIKSVNHRHLDLQVRVPTGLDALEPAMRRAVKAAVRRGHVEILLLVGRGPAAAMEFDQEVLAAHVAEFRRLANGLGLKQEPDLNVLLRLPGVMNSQGSAMLDAGAAETAVMATFSELLLRFNESREAEGRTLAAELSGGMARMQALFGQARVLREGIAEAETKRLGVRIAELIASVRTETGIDEARLLTEAGLLAARGDIEEELVRLRTHVDRFAEIIAAGGEVGRALDFLLQELNREANTLLSKTGGSAAGLRLTEIGLEMKVELERAREQVQNLE